MAKKSRTKTSQDPAKSKLPFSERRQEILDAVLPLLAEKGLKAVTTKDLAKAAGVSEALLYRHFSSKEKMFAEVQEEYCRPMPAVKVMLDELTPGTEGFCHVLGLLARILVQRVETDEKRSSFVPRMLLHSFAEDGQFADSLYRRCFFGLTDFVQQCFKNARLNGDLNPLDEKFDALRFWFCHDTFVMIYIHRMPALGFFGYPKESEALRDESVLFALRGAGFKEGAVKESYRPHVIYPKVDRWLQAL